MSTIGERERRKKKIQRKFKNRGYHLKVGDLDLIADHFQQDADEEADHFPHEAIDQLLNLLQKESFDAESIQRCLGSAKEESTTSASSLLFIDAFMVPKYRYDAVTKRFIILEDMPPLVHGEASAKTELYRERFMLLKQRVSRSEYFSRPEFDSDTTQIKKHEISSVQSLMFQVGRKWVMGMISQLEDGHFYLEDLSASYKITTGFFTENTIILADGEMKNGIFQVITCGFPPLEERIKTLKTHSEYDFFGGSLQEEMVIPESSSFVILSDIWLDDEEVLGKLETVLDGFERDEKVPTLFVLMGNFCSRPCNLSFACYSSLRQQFGELGRMIGKHRRLKEESRFLFIPGPDDACHSTVLPSCGLPNYLTKELRDVIPNAIILSNPCRVKFYNQEIVFFRQDLVYRMRRSCLITPSFEETDDPFEHLACTIVQQSHLCPLPLMVQPIIWNYDHSLRLYPTPHTIVLGDKSEQKECKIGETACLNPGSFATDCTFVLYRPSTQHVQLSAL
ncbi:unnamed protein product [Thlaspi arvense]|uniref:DNA polymerase epsilon subunit n=1 Tax=Thlaspi arvense TaxID=13288 RepID=A0AAU9SC86_THLAR|nr:unnamed protein product [Thlaspi arvense]